MASCSAPRAFTQRGLRESIFSLFPMVFSFIDHTLHFVIRKWTFWREQLSVVCQLGVALTLSTCIFRDSTQYCTPPSTWKPAEYPCSSILLVAVHRLESFGRTILTTHVNLIEFDPVRFPSCFLYPDRFIRGGSYFCGFPCDEALKPLTPSTVTLDASDISCQ